MKDVTPMFIPFCGLFGALAGQFLYGGGRYTVIGIGAGLILGVVFRIVIRYRRNRPK